MKTRLRVLVTLALCLLFAAVSSHAKADALGELKFITENYAPYNYQKDGEIHGSAVKLLLDMFKEAGTNRGPQDIEVMNWARGYKLAQDTENTVLFSTTRTKVGKSSSNGLVQFRQRRLSSWPKRAAGLKLRLTKISTSIVLVQSVMTLENCCYSAKG